MNFKIQSLFILLSSIMLYSCKPQIISPTDNDILLVGRHLVNENSSTIAWPGSGIRFKTNSDSVIFYFEDLGENYFQVIVNKTPYCVLKLEKSKKEYKIGFPRGTKTIELFKKTESEFGRVVFSGIKLDCMRKLFSLSSRKTNFMFIGNSITCGYGNEAKSETEPYIAETENAYMSFASITAREFDAEFHLIAFSGKGIVRNWAQNPPFVENMPVLFERTLPLDTTRSWDHQKFIPHVIFINLGTNDTSPGYEMDSVTFCSAYTRFLKRLVGLYPDAKVVMLTSQMLVNKERINVIYWLQSVKKAENNPNIYYFALSQQDGTLGFGADFHPSIKQNEKNAGELIDFIYSNLGDFIKTE